MAESANSTFQVIPVPVNSDNYAYVIVDLSTKQAAVVDPCQPRKVLAAAAKAGANVTHILTTHHHGDHAGGNVELVKLRPEVVVVGGKADNVAAVTKRVSGGDTLKIGSLEVRVLHTPCHTRGHVLYYVTAGDQGSLFTGDTLFVGGCGRFFEGDAQGMYSAMKQISQLPDETQIWCGHEYTVGNLRFAVTVEPDNERLAKKYKWALERRAAGLQTIPSTVFDEKSFNPFMRTDLPSLQRYAGSKDPIVAMAELRRRKNAFRG